MADKTNEFQVWKDLTPVVNIVSDAEFDVWQNLTPVEDMDESFSQVIITTRRRVTIF